MKPHRSTQSSSTPPSDQGSPTNVADSQDAGRAVTRTGPRPGRPSQRRAVSDVATRTESLGCNDSFPAGGVSRLEAAEQLVREATHGLRTPLATVRESVRLVHDGDLGTVSSQQADCLGVAMEQCDRVSEMLSEMSAVDRLLTGSPTVHRSAVELEEVREAVNQAVSRSLPANVSLLWDVADGPPRQVFVDSSLLCRMLVHLVKNASAVSDQTPVCIRVLPERDRETIKWSVIDGGRGLTQEELQRIDRPRVSTTGGSGLGLNICRQIAGLHFSSLQITSKIGFGTEVSFETPSAGPHSVAESWCRWRRRYPFGQDGRGDDGLGDGGEQAFSARVIGHTLTRYDSPVKSSGNQNAKVRPSVGRRTLWSDRGDLSSPEELVAGTVTLGAACPIVSADRFDRFLQSQLRCFDLVYRVADRRWVWIFDTPVDEMKTRLLSLTDGAAVEIVGARLRWSGPQIIPVDGRKMLSRVSDLLVRETLSSLTDSRYFEPDAVRMGTAPIPVSPIATARLDEELRRNSLRLKKQTSTLRRHARQMRP